MQLSTLCILCKRVNNVCLLFTHVRFVWIPFYLILCLWAYWHLCLLSCGFALFITAAASELVSVPLQPPLMGCFHDLGCFSDSCKARFSLCCLCQTPGSELFKVVLPKSGILFEPRQRAAVCVSQLDVTDRAVCCVSHVQPDHTLFIALIMAFHPLLSSISWHFTPPPPH